MMKGTDVQGGTSPIDEGDQRLGGTAPIDGGDQRLGGMPQGTSV